MPVDTPETEVSEEIHEEIQRQKLLIYQQAVGGLSYNELAQEPSDWVEYVYNNKLLDLEQNGQQGNN